MTETQLISLCDAHGIPLPPESIEQVVEIVRLATASAPGVDAGALKLLDSIIVDMETGFVKCENCSEQEDTATLDFMPQLLELRAALLVRASEAAPIDMLLFCPKCNTQHIDAPDERTEGWSNPSHRSHLCHSCGTVWRPADVPTNGVASIETKGKADTWIASEAAGGEPIGEAHRFVPYYEGVEICEQCKATRTAPPAASSDQFEHLDVQNHAYRRTMQTIMARLTSLLDEDQFAEIEGLVKSVGVEPPVASKEWCIKKARQEPDDVDLTAGVEPCDMPPSGWVCTRGKGHEGPCTAHPAASGQKLTYPDDFTDDLQWILGLVCFQCISYAQALRKGGRDIPTKAEAEQAATLDYLLRQYLRDPENWRERASMELRAMMSDSAIASDKEGT